MTGKGIAAKEIQKAVHLALGVMKTPRARPAVGTAENGRVTVRVDDTTQLVGEQVGQLVPCDGDEFVVTAPGGRTWPVAQPAAAYDRRGYP